ncbi:beta-ketoacyl synthase N-terminal-like domain-containing protein [Streptomyces sp. ISL-66]|uniref:type I polyketide synthase n=1 Tax=Streptomyces sp. ISL-66 TaxID=2819186 RepID=UPI0027E53712|nr:beta-ketoacyl synthase N-terminal-like domain-containing protein [Streptomyces sp. ISL-66]
MAVIGMALRFPGAETPEQYWRDIVSGASHVRPFTEAEFAAAGLPQELYRDPDFTGSSALLHGIDGFDAAFFGMSGREATLTDPQQRLFLECCHHVLEDGGYAGTADRVGVYASIGYRLYSLHSYLAAQIGESSRSDDWTEVKQIQVGNYADFTANRASFRLGLEGPAVNVATACSSGLVSVHLAVQALLAGDADLMVVGSAALHLPQVTGHRHVRGSTISPTGAVRAFDAAADGTVGGNGVAAVLLKPLAKALADGDTVHAVLLGSAVTNDGAGKAGFAAPGVAGQRDAVLGALDAAGVGADTIGYLEAHGTGTYKGDPIEFAALTEAFRRHTDRTGFCALGSTKPAIGHLDSAAGLAGLIKAVLVLRHGTVPPLVNFTRPNPLLGVEDSPFVLPRRATPWPAGGPRRAGVHSIGMGGTNAHVILEEAPAAPARTPGAPVPALLPLSAQTPRALEDSARALRDTLRRSPDLDPADVLTTLALGRRHLRHRLVVTAPSGDVAGALDAFLTDSARREPGEDAAGTGAAGTGAAAGTAAAAGAAYCTGTVEAGEAVAPAFVFSGQGSGRPGMAAALAGRFPVVAEVLRECARVHREETGEDTFLDRLVAGEGPAQWDTAFAQPAIFALQVAQARLWRQLGVTPSAVAGHSVGEYAALCVAGALSVEDGMRLLCRRGRLMQDTEPGAMLVVFSPLERVRDLLDAPGGPQGREPAHGRLELAVTNGPAHHVLAGRPQAVEAARARLAERGEASELLPVDRAFHTALLEPVLDALRAAAEKAVLRPVQVEFVSGLDGTAHPPGWLPDADYLVRQARRTADFHAVLRTLAPRPVLVELGHGAPLAAMARRAAPGTPCVPTQRQGTGPDALWAAVARLYCAGAAVDWTALLDGCAGRRIPLPGYPFQHRSYWTGPPPHPGPAARSGTAVDHARTNQGSMEDGMTQQDVLGRVLELTARHLGYERDEVGAGQTFIGLGADSLQLIGMLKQLEGEFGVRISVRDVLEDAGTPELTARLIASRRATAAPAATAPAKATSSLTAAAPFVTAAPVFAEPAAAPAAVVIPAQPPGPAPAPATPPAEQSPYGYRSELAELRRQIDVLAETQAAMLVQLSEAVALLGAERVR